MSARGTTLPSECVSIVIVVGVACLSTALRPLAATAVAAVAAVPLAVAGVDDFVDVLVEFDGESQRETERKRERGGEITHPTAAQAVLGNSMRRRHRRPGNMIMCMCRSRRSFKPSTFDMQQSVRKFSTALGDEDVLPFVQFDVMLHKLCLCLSLCLCLCLRCSL